MNAGTCDACAHWRQGDPTGRIGNVGTCTALVVATPIGENSEGFYDRNPHSPFWAQRLTFTTTSWQGAGCTRFEQVPT